MKRALLRRAMRAVGFCAAVISPAALSATASPGNAATSYTADPAASRLEFTGIQAGAPFKAVFHKFTAAIDISPDALADAHFDVAIDMNSVDSMDEDRDSTMRGADLFDAAHFPTAHYVTHGAATKTAAGYAAGGALTLRGVTKEVPIEFTFAATAAGTKLTGTAKLKRLDFGVGQGDWKSTEGVGNDVSVAFSLVLNPRPSR